MTLRLYLLLTLLCGGQALAETLQLSVASYGKNAGVEKSPCVLRLQSALQTLGYQLELNYLPSARALQQANAGLVDGDLARTSLIEDEYVNLLRVARPCSNFEPVLYGLAGGPVDWRQRHLKRIAYFRGSRFLLSSLANAIQDYELELTNTVDQGLKLLQAGRVDAVFISKPLFDHLRENRSELTRDVVQLTPDLEDVKLYTYLHKRHEGLLTELDALMLGE